MSRVDDIEVDYIETLIYVPMILQAARSCKLTGAGQDARGV